MSIRLGLLQLMMKIKTFKRKHEKNLDETFSNLMTKAYWVRRKMQLDLNFSIKKKNTLNLDFFITNFIFFIVRFF